MRTGISTKEMLMILLGVGALFIVLAPLFARRETGVKPTCLNNQRQIAFAILMYAYDHGDTMPNASTIWQEVSIDTSARTCHVGKRRISDAYIYNSLLSHKALVHLTQIADTTILTGDGRPGVGVATRTDDFVFRHDGRAIVSFLDGHVSPVKDLTPYVLAP